MKAVKHSPICELLNLPQLQSGDKNSNCQGSSLGIIPVDWKWKTKSFLCYKTVSGLFAGPYSLAIAYQILTWTEIKSSTLLNAQPAFPAFPLIWWGWALHIFAAVEIR